MIDKSVEQSKALDLQTERTTEASVDLADQTLYPDSRQLNVPVPTRAELKATFEQLAQSTYRGVPGVMKIDSGVPGPTVGITVMTHGNEPAGVASLWAGLQEGGALTNLTCGSVIVAIGNLQAATEYFDEPEDSPIEQKATHRSVDLNMNRLPEDLEAADQSITEVARAKEPLPVLAEFEFGLDIHSTDTPSEPILIEDKPISNELLKSFPARTIITNIMNVQQNKPLAYFFGGENPCTKVALEAGSHEDIEALANAIQATEGMLHSMGMLEQNESTERYRPILYQRYEVTGSIVWQEGDENMMLAKSFDHLEPITEGQVLASDPVTGKEVLCEKDGHALFPFATGKPNQMGEEGMFITGKLKKIIL